MAVKITNNVTINQLANATIAIGASPIMATAPEEMEDLSKQPGALLVNMGTIKDKESMLLAGRFANIERKPGLSFNYACYLVLIRILNKSYSTPLGLARPSFVRNLAMVSFRESHYQ